LDSDSPLDRQSDAALIARFVAVRDEEAFRELVRRHGPMVLSTCARMLRHRHDAEDAFQAVFVILAARSRALRRVRTLGGWLHNVAVRVSYGVLRSNRRRERRLVARQHQRRPEQDNHVRELQDVLDEELTALPEKYREALVLCDLEGYTREEAARKLNASPSTVGTWVDRGRRRLRDRLVRRGVTVGAGGLAAALAQCAQTAHALPPVLMNETIRIAELFLLGTGVSGVAAVAKITSLAQGELNNMFLKKLSTPVGIAVLVLALILGASPLSKVVGLTLQVRAAQFFVDDFEDGNIFDGNPVTWRTEGPPFDASINEVVNGSLVLTPPDSMPPLEYVESNLTANGLSFGDVSLRTRVRAQRSGSYYVGLAGRNTFRPENGLVGTNVVAYMQDDGMLFLATNRNEVVEQLASGPSGMDAASYDVNMQFDMSGRSVAFTVWRDGTPKPTVPQLSVATMPTYVANEGAVSMFNVQFLTPEAKIPVEFRYFQAIPEPSSVAVGSLGAVVLLGYTFRKRLVCLKGLPDGQTQLQEQL
jgi:RNA polymerase sigma factor (sigma-70 family)